jgi:murein DD-endopeptidase MepM/ murein hydrolase activator NlpD
MLLVASLACALALPHGAFAATSTELYLHRQAADEARRKAAIEQKRADALIAETRRLENQIQAIAGEVQTLQGQIGTTTERRASLEEQIESLRSGIAEKQTQIGGVKAEFEAQSDALAARADATYRAGDWVYLEWLLTAEDVGDLLERTTFVQTIMLRDQEIALALDDTRAQLEEAEQGLQRSLDEVSVKRAEVQAEEERLRRLRSDRDSKLKAEKTAKSQKAALLAESKENIARLKAIAAAEDRESARIAAELRSGSSKGSGRYAGTMTWPCPGYERIGSVFGMRYHPILHYNRMHTGIDVSAPKGAALVAAGSGVIISAGWRGGYGNCVMIDHGDGLVTVYAHMSSISVSNGQRVTSGQRIGAVGSTGLSTGPHLHFEVRVNGTAVNPLAGYV